MEESERVLDLSTAAERHLKKLSKIILEGRRPPPGPYAVFYEISNTLEKLWSCRMLVERLFEASDTTLKLMEREAAIMPKNWPAGVPFSEDVSGIMREERRISMRMRIDFESLYIFAGILLDQWALVAGRVGSINVGAAHPFVNLFNHVRRGKGGILGPLWKDCRERLIWIHYHIRFYRNRLIVHGNRPWQRGTSKGVGRIEYLLVTLSPVGWTDEDAVYRECLKLVPHLTAAYPDLSLDNWKRMPLRTLLGTLFDGIDRVEHHNQREQIANLYSELGGSTPSFQVVAAGLFEFLGEATAIVCKVADDNLGKIDIGYPYKTNAEI